MATQGTVYKFIGDAVMGIWNAPIEDASHVANACAAVLACIEANRDLNKEFEREGWPAYHTRFGLHVGEAVVGNIGSPDRMNYTVLGSTVNLAARLEAQGLCGGGSDLRVARREERQAQGRHDGGRGGRLQVNEAPRCQPPWPGVAWSSTCRTRRERIISFSRTQWRAAIPRSFGLASRQ